MKKKLVKRVEKLVVSDRNRVTIHGLTKLGILEITRKKSVDSVVARTKQGCAVCHNSGWVDDSHMQVEAILRELDYFRHHTDENAVLYQVSGSVLDFAKENKLKLASELASIGFKMILVEGDTAVYSRLKADSEEKLIDFAKKTGSLEVFRI